MSWTSNCAVSAPASSGTSSLYSGRSSPCPDGTAFRFWVAPTASAGNSGSSRGCCGGAGGGVAGPCRCCCPGGGPEGAPLGGAPGGGGPGGTPWGGMPGGPGGG